MLKNRVQDIIALPQKYLTKGTFGLEIEVEGKNLPFLDNEWKTERDGSLRNESYEYVLKKPTTLNGIRAAVDTLDETYMNMNSMVDNSIRAGVHVHLNVQSWTITEVYTFATVYYILEDLLVHWCGPSREGNHFCLRAKDAEGVIMKLWASIKDRRLDHLNTDFIRYSSLNFCSLFKYGSLEFRAMRSSNDLQDIVKWVMIINELRKSMHKFKTPTDVMAQASGLDLVDFVQTVLPTYHKELIKIDNVEEVLWESIRRVQAIAYGIDWNSLNKPRTNPFELNGDF